MTERLKQLPSDTDHTPYMVDFSLLVPTLILSEALLNSYKQQKIIMAFLSFIITNRAKVGKPKLIQWLKTTNFQYTKELEQILRTTPLGNPAWGLFGSSPSTFQLLEDLEEYTSKVSSKNPKSLKSLIKYFLRQYPQYNAVKDPNPDEWTTFRRATWDEINVTGDITTRLILLQRAGVPKSKRQLIMEAKTGATPNEIVKVEKDDFPIHRPDSSLYEIAIRDLLIGMGEVDRKVWNEMVEMYMGKHLTNFLAFAPLLLQPFARSNMNIPVPNINTLATLMGNFTGATGSFMGEITRSKKTVRWETLGLTIGKLCGKTETLSDVSLHRKEEDQEIKKLYKNLDTTTRLCGDLSEMTETPLLGEDLGHTIIHEDLLTDRWNINLTDINNSIITDKIYFKNFPIVRRSLVFTTSTILTRLNHWSRKQMKQKIIRQQQADSGGSFKLPSTQDLATNNFSVLPLLTYTFRMEKKSQNGSVDHKSHLIAEGSVRPNKCLGCEGLGDFSAVTSDVEMDFRFKQTRFPDELGSIDQGSHKVAVLSPRSSKPESIDIDLLRKSSNGFDTVRQQDSKLSLAQLPSWESSSGHDVENQVNGSKTVDHHHPLPTRKKRYLQPPCCKRGQSVKTSVCRRVGLSEQADSERGTFTNKPPSVPDDGISRFFIAETYTEDRLKKEQVLKLRHQRLVTLKEEAKRRTDSLYFRSMTDETLQETITKKLEYFKLPSSRLVGLRPSHDKELEHSFVELIRRDLGFHINSETFDRPLRFRYFLGDEEAVGIDTWYLRSPNIPTTRAVHRIWVALTFIWITRHLTKEGKAWTEKDLWKSEDFYNYPLVDEDRFAVLSLVPYLYWICYLGKPDVFRKHEPDLSTVLFVPTSRISQFDDDDDDTPTTPPEERSATKLIYPDPLRGVRVSSLSLCSFHDWAPDDILKSANSFFKMKYSPDLHPEQTKYIRLYVKLGVESILGRLSNKNLAHILSHISPLKSQLLTEDVWDLFKQLRERIREWYQDFIKAFYRKWTLTQKEWIHLEELTTDEITYDENGFVLHL